MDADGDDDDDDDKATPKTGKYGPFNMLDRRSMYGRNWFPEPFLAEDSDLEHELRFDYLHAERSRRRFDSGSVQLEYAVGIVGLELGATYEANRQSVAVDPDGDDFASSNSQGFGNIELGAHVPFFQYVSPQNFFDTTFVAGLQISPPTLSPISKDTEIAPLLANLTRFGDHLSLQTSIGLSTLIGPVGRGSTSLEYSAVLGYEIKNKLIPYLETVTPILEMQGDTGLNKSSAGQNQLFGVTGLRFDFNRFGFAPVSPNLGFGFMTPLDNGARNEFRWGVLTSLVFEY